MKPARPLPAGPVRRVEGRGLPMPGNDIDTDRILPARFLRAVRFEGFEAHVFVDEREMERAAGRVHAFDRPGHQGAAVLVVNGNFGCGSSREHAPQGLLRWGIRAIVGESYSEIFFGNAVALGLPCVSVAAEDASWLQALVTGDPAARLALDLETMTLQAAGRTMAVGLPPGARDAFLTGAWDATGLLLEDPAATEAVAARLPYITGF
jgi:3-isopropylmalate/(R)-2-methylmalate dehydratase small subunit